MKKETETIELKAKFNFSAAKKEISGLLNSSIPGEKVQIFFGYDDKTGELIEGYKKIKESDGKDLLIDFLEPYEVKYDFIDLPNKGFGVEIISNKRLVLADNKIYTRKGTSKKPINSSDYKKILKNKNIEILAPTTIEYNANDFNKLEKYLADKGFNFKLSEFLTQTSCIVKIKGKVYLTFLALFVKDDSKLKIIINKKEVEGPIFELYTFAYNELKLHVDTIKQSINGSENRYMFKDKNPEYIKIIREMLSNLFIHSHYKLTGPDAKMEIKYSEWDISMKNSHADEQLKQKIDSKRVPTNIHNISLWILLKKMRLVEGERTGFTLFFENEKNMSFKVDISEYKVTYKGDK